MRLIAEALGEVERITPDILDQTLREDSFGKFVVLVGPDGEFLQAGCVWDSSARCAAFVRETGSDPWVLECREQGALRRAEGLLTGDEVRVAFGEYLRGERRWWTSRA